MDNNTNQDALDLLRQLFGYDQFRPLQHSIISSLIAGRDNFVLMPTGGGKSLCYQIPALVRQGMGVVISPLIALMQDQVQALQSNGIKAAYYNSSLSSKDARVVLEKVQARRLDLLYVSPERLMLPWFIDFLKQQTLALFAVDEAHCVSQWGPDFRPEYLQLGQLKQIFPDIPMIALTATADKQTRHDIPKKLNLSDYDFHLGSFNRHNIRYSVLEKHNPFKQLLKFVEQHREQSGIIYCLTRARVEEIASKLSNNGYKAKPYHAGLESKERQKTQDAFQKDDINIVVATIAFGMGIDKPNVRFVVHYDLPKNLESYYQETGRAGRDGLASESLLLYGLSDVAIARGLITQNRSEEQRRIELHKLNMMTAFVEAQSCRRRVLLNYFDEQLAQDCDNCDTCLSPPELFEATEDCRKALSCVYRVGQRFGVSYVIDVLRGLENPRIKSLRHNQLNVYGMGRHLSQEAWHSIFRQLIHLGYLEQDVANYSVLKLKERSRPLLIGEEQIRLAKPRIKTETIQPKTKLKPVGTDLTGDPLFQKLKSLRKSLAQAANVAPFIIFNDATLQELVVKKPTTKDDFINISGVGAKKLESYGQIFIDAIEDFLSA